MLGLLLLLFFVLIELLLNLHELMVRPIFEEDHVPHQVDLLQAFVHLFNLLVEVGVHWLFHHLRSFGMPPLLPLHLSYL